MLADPSVAPPIDLAPGCGARVALLLLAGALLAACAAPAAPQSAPTAAPNGAAAPTAPAPTFVFIVDPQVMLADLPPALATVDGDAPAAPADPAARAAWDAPVAQWGEVAATAARLDGADEAAIAAERRIFALALRDGLALAALARAQGADVADDAVLAELAWRLIAAAHPLRADPARAAAPTAAWAGYWRGEATAAAVVAGRALGAAAAPAIIAAQAAHHPPAAQPGAAGE